MKKLGVVVILSLAILSLAAISAFASSYTLEQAKIQFDIPDTWKANDIDLGTAFTSPSGDLTLILSDVEGSGTEEALKMAEELIGKVVTDFKPGEPKEDKVNDIDVWEIEGPAKTTLDGKEVDVSLTLMHAGEAAFGMMVYFGEKTAVDNNIVDLGEFVKSLSKVQ